jgi:hypothetical protein
VLSLTRCVRLMIPLTDFGLQCESTYQNTCEFLAVVAGLATLAWRGVRHSAVHIIGDNRSSLAWCQYECFHSTLSRAASMTFMAITTICDIQISDATHIRGLRNIVPDRLSRAFERGVDADAVYLDLGLAGDVRLDYSGYTTTPSSGCGLRSSSVIRHGQVLERLRPMGSHS